MKKIIFDLELTYVYTTIVEQARHNRNWPLAYSLIPKCNLYDSIEKIYDVIKKHNISTAVVNTSPQTYVEKVVDYFNIPVNCIVSYHDAKPIKPHPAPMLKALELIGCSTKEAVSFGDRDIDIQASNAAGIESVACLWAQNIKQD